MCKVTVKADVADKVTKNIYIPKIQKQIYIHYIIHTNIHKCFACIKNHIKRKLVEIVW